MAPLNDPEEDDSAVAPYRFTAVCTVPRLIGWQDDLKLKSLRSRRRSEFDEIDGNLETVI